MMWLSTRRTSSPGKVHLIELKAHARCVFQHALMYESLQRDDFFAQHLSGVCGLKRVLESTRDSHCRRKEAVGFDCSQLNALDCVYDSGC